MTDLSHDQVETSNLSKKFGSSLSLGSSNSNNDSDSKVNSPNLSSTPKKSHQRNKSMELNGPTNLSPVKPTPLVLPLKPTIQQFPPGLLDGLPTKVWFEIETCFWNGEYERFEYLIKTNFSKSKFLAKLYLSTFYVIGSIFTESAEHFVHTINLLDNLDAAISEFGNSPILWIPIDPTSPKTSDETQPPPSYTNVPQILTSLCSSHSFLLRAALFLRTGGFLNYSKGSYYIKKAWNQLVSVKKLYPISQPVLCSFLRYGTSFFSDQPQLCTTFLNLHPALHGWYLCLIGTFQFFFSLLPRQFQWIIEAIGFDINRALGYKSLSASIMKPTSNFRGFGTILLCWIQLFFLKDHNTELSSPTLFLNSFIEYYPSSPLFSYLAGYGFRRIGYLHAAHFMFFNATGLGKEIPFVPSDHISPTLDSPSQIIHNFAPHSSKPTPPTIEILENSATTTTSTTSIMFDPLPDTAAPIMKTEMETEPCTSNLGSDCPQILTLSKILRHLTPNLLWTGHTLPISTPDQNRLINKIVYDLKHREQQASTETYPEFRSYLPTSYATQFQSKYNLYCLYEMAWCVYLSGDWYRASAYFQQFLALNLPSTSFNAYCALQYALSLDFLGFSYYASRVMAAIPSLVRKHFSYDEWAERISLLYLEQFNLIVNHLNVFHSDGGDFRTIPQITPDTKLTHVVDVAISSFFDPLNNIPFPDANNILEIPEDSPFSPRYHSPLALTQITENSDSVPESFSPVSSIENDAPSPLSSSTSESNITNLSGLNSNKEYVSFDSSVGTGFGTSSSGSRSPYYSKSSNPASSTSSALDNELQFHYEKSPRANLFHASQSVTIVSNEHVKFQKSHLRRTRSSSWLSSWIFPNEELENHQAILPTAIRSLLFQRLYNLAKVHLEAKRPRHGLHLLWSTIVLPDDDLETNIIPIETKAQISGIFHDPDTKSYKLIPQTPDEFAICEYLYARHFKLLEEILVQENPQKRPDFQNARYFFQKLMVREGHISSYRTHMFPHSLFHIAKMDFLVYNLGYSNKSSLFAIMDLVIKAKSYRNYNLDKPLTRQLLSLSDSIQAALKKS